MSGFVLRGLDPAPFAPLFDLDDEALAARAARRVVATSKPGYPCRVSLVDAEPGEALILANFEHLPVASPFRSRHAVYVRADAAEPAEYRDSLPDQFRTRTLSLRAFDDGGMMVDADLADGREAEVTIRRMLNDPQVAYLHAHFAKPGCFAARIDRG
ncbi:DUF1203 domain-containing protein [Sphingomonas sp. AR_OL41]|jgi:hypothetical protein|uniref:DUF1203 domain-containing protein n=1 Tax=Sphingomonas sp. AR_OL41 TaxID=3042729 RepID=UPI002480497E|nr:DUF1203 domain-containing protein [Sphingomonas sp. AR_OL41]MDH7972613.1 DUF1203 domain-containing protein [Sphingomonas sp. AR_OL41]